MGASWEGAFVSDYEWVFALLGFLADGTGRGDLFHHHRGCLEENPLPKEGQVVYREDAAIQQVSAGYQDR